MLLLSQNQLTKYEFTKGFELMKCLDYPDELHWVLNSLLSDRWVTQCSVIMLNSTWARSWSDTGKWPQRTISESLSGQETERFFLECLEDTHTARLIDADFVLLMSKSQREKSGYNLCLWYLWHIITIKMEN